MKKSKIVKITTDRREYRILTIIPYKLEMECCCCPLYNKGCCKHKHTPCKPNRILERNWKSQRKTQWK